MNSTKKLILDYVNERKTLIGIGPMSKNSTDACIELSDTYDVPMMLIPSRRQVDSKFLGGGYANNWSTEDFSKYVNKNSINKRIWTKPAFSITKRKRFNLYKLKILLKVLFICRH